MDTFIIISVIIIGMIFGSFFNVVGYRLPKEMSLVYPSSHCPNCNHKLKWYELIPVFSYLFLRGKCSSCHQKISIMYPIGELLTGILFAVSYLIFGFSSQFIIAILITAFLVIIISSDVNYLIIPDEVTLVFAIMFCVVKLFEDGLLVMSEYILSGVVLFLIMYLIMRIGNYVFKKESLGGGDIKLMLVTGIVIGVPLGLFSIFLASILALLPSIALGIKNKNSLIPFGPFLVFSLLVIYLSQMNLQTLLNLFA